MKNQVTQQQEQYCNKQRYCRSLDVVDERHTYVLCIHTFSFSPHWEIFPITHSHKIIVSTIIPAVVDVLQTIGALMHRLTKPRR